MVLVYGIAGLLTLLREGGDVGGEILMNVVLTIYISGLESHLLYHLMSSDRLIYLHTEYGGRQLEDDGLTAFRSRNFIGSRRQIMV